MARIKQKYKGIAGELTAQAAADDRDDPVILYTYRGPARKFNINSSFLRNNISVRSPNPIRIRTSRS